MNKHTITVKVRPKVKDRPRMTRRGRVYTPKTTLAFESIIANAWDGPKFTGPVSVEIVLRKDSIRITIKELDVESTPLRGDVDNYAKSILDGLNNVAYVDDRQVRELKVKK